MKSGTWLHPHLMEEGVMPAGHPSSGPQDQNVYNKGVGLVQACLMYWNYILPIVWRGTCTDIPQ